MGKRTKLREAQRRADEQILSARLRHRGRRKPRPAFIASYGEFSPDFLARIEPYRSFALRSPQEWRCKLRVRAPKLRFLELVKFTFADFSVPAHLENAWFESTIDAASGARSPDFRRWYIVAAQGGSLYREFAHRLLSRAETHHFLAAPSAIKSARQALWYAVARAHGTDEAMALRVARTKLTGFAFTPFWKDVARYFVRNPAPILDMNDLIDFMQAAKAADPGFSVNGRSLSALRRRMFEWHEMLRRGVSIGRERWTGNVQPNLAYEIGDATWRFRQIKTAQRLFEEGERMHHCVAGYRSCCVAGQVSIWSLTCERQGRLTRCLTIEVDAAGVIVQCRGFANRAPTDIELAIMARWAREQFFACSDWLREPNN